MTLTAVIDTSFRVAHARADLARAEADRDDAVRAALAEHTGAQVAAATAETGARINEQRVSQIRRGGRR